MVIQIGNVVHMSAAWFAAAAWVFGATCWVLGAWWYSIVDDYCSRADRDGCEQ